MRVVGDNVECSGFLVPCISASPDGVSDPRLRGPTLAIDQVFGAIAAAGGRDYSTGGTSGYLGSSSENCTHGRRFESQ
jgi:hypothetical protein